MFGMGFTEIVLILIVAVIALGPDKLPTAAIEIAKFFKKFKTGIEEAKSTINSELNIAEIQNIKNEAQEFQSNIHQITNTNINDLTGLDDDILSNLEDTLKPKKKAKFSYDSSKQEDYSMYNNKEA
jgi:sec-independent protein translocase protein TatB